jgi:hypothetical protein
MYIWFLFILAWWLCGQRSPLARALLLFCTYYFPSPTWEQWAHWLHLRIRKDGLCQNKPCWRPTWKFVNPLLGTGCAFGAKRNEEENVPLISLLFIALHLKNTSCPLWLERWCFIEERHIVIRTVTSLTTWNCITYILFGFVHPAYSIPPLPPSASAFTFLVQKKASTHAGETLLWGNNRGVQGDQLHRVANSTGRLWHLNGRDPKWEIEVWGKLK